MHPEAFDAVRRMMVSSDFVRYESPVTPERPRLAVDFGGADVNGTARELFDPATEWLGLDIAPGSGVDIVADARSWNGPVDMGDPVNVSRDTVYGATLAVDLVLCTELLEHVPPPAGLDPDTGWMAVLGTIHRVLKPGGFAFVTCASTGRRPHGARGEMDPPQGEHYRNVDPDLFMDTVQGQPWADYDWQFNPNPGDLYAWMRKA